MEILEIVLYCICTAIRFLVNLMQTAILLRSVLSWFPIDENGFLPRLLFCLTEPVIIPVRALLSCFGVGEDSPIDFSPMVAMLLLIVISMFLPVITL